MLLREGKLVTSCGLVLQKLFYYFMLVHQQTNIKETCPKCTDVQNVQTQILGEKIMKKTISISIFNKISANFKGEIHNIKRDNGDWIRCTDKIYFKN
ncbi:MAG: hypothetical protein LBQ66_05895, partial [Planctomycetaceae bacterium]|nr:hypothetical protein [Planctomycetaceae bacterium]